MAKNCGPGTKGAGKPPKGGKPMPKPKGGKK